MEVSSGNKRGGWRMGSTLRLPGVVLQKLTLRAQNRNTGPGKIYPSPFSLVLILMLGVAMNACSSSESWKEEVQLNDGRTIVVERETLHERGGDEWVLNRSGTKPKERRIRFANPSGSGQMIEWRTTKKFETWPEKPLILDVEAVQPIIFSLVAISIGCEIYFKYVYRNNVWVEEALPEKFAQRTTNLFIRDGTDMPKFVNLETKRKGNAEIGYRPALKQVGPTRQVCG